MLQIGKKVFMNIQEAVGWLLQNNALPFQSTANYVADTEIAKSTIINPSPAEVKVGSLVLFADSKIGTVSGVTSNGFMVSSSYTDIQNAIAYISGVTINASQHLITTLSDGTTKDAGLIKMITSFSINGSQHLIANYNDGTTTDLGAIFTGNVNISGTLNATAVTGDSIIETMSGYTFTLVNDTTNLNISIAYAGAVKNGNKLTFVIFGKIKRTGELQTSYLDRKMYFTIPSALLPKLVRQSIANVTALDCCKVNLIGPYYVNFMEKTLLIDKVGGTQNITFDIYELTDGSMTLDQDYTFRIEKTFLLSDNLAA